MASEDNPAMKRDKPTPAPWRAPLDRWACALSAAGRSRPTIATRTDHLRRLARAFPCGPQSVTADGLTEWAGRQTWARETRRSVYASLRSFFRWLGGDNPAAGLPMIQAANPLPRPTPDRVYQSARLASDDRVTLILRLAAEAGLRRAEIAVVHERDLSEDLAGWTLLVHGKGGRLRMVPLTASLALAVRAAVMKGGGWAFPGDDGGHLSPRYVGKLATRVLPGDWTLHSLRHRFASVAYAGSRDMLAVQRLLGHASPATTQRYVRLPDDALRAAALHAA